MSKKNHEKNHFNMANKIYAKRGQYNGELYRLFRVYHPMYEIDVNIETQNVDDNYHIIEKYMDELVCGYTEDSERIADGVYIRNESELFELLGINTEAYEIAEKFYQDLVDAGHFETSQNGILPKQPAINSIKLDKRVSESTQREKKLFDLYSMKLVPADFYDLNYYAVDSGNVENLGNANRLSVWLPAESGEDRSAGDIQNMMNNTEYVNSERIDRGLPRGYKRMFLGAETDIEVKFLPYYLALFKTSNGIIYRAFRIDNGAPIEWIGEQFATTEYKLPRERINRLATLQEEQTVNNPICDDFLISDKGVPSAENGVSRMADSQNYIWKLTDKQLGFLIGVDGAQGLKKSPCNKIANNEIACLNNYEAGKIIYIKKTEAQKRLLLDCIPLSLEEREELFAQYLKSKG